MTVYMVATDKGNTGTIAGNGGWARRVQLSLPQQYVADIVGAHIYATDIQANMVGGLCHNLDRGVGASELDVMNEQSGWFLHSFRDQANGRLNTFEHPITVAGDQLFYGHNGASSLYVAARIIYTIRKVGLTEWTMLKRATSQETA